MEVAIFLGILLWDYLNSPKLLQTGFDVAFDPQRCTVAGLGMLPVSVGSKPFSLRTGSGQQGKV